MLAYVYDSERRFGLMDAPMPREGADNAVLRVEACAICGTDLRARRFGSEGVAVPRIVGHEVTGELVHVGSAIRGFKTGERVNVAPAIGCGRCPPCRKGFPNLCDELKTIGFQYDGGFAEYMEIPQAAFAAGNVIALEDPSLEADDVVLVEPTACVVNGQDPLRIGEGDSVLVFGSGFIGCMHARLALMKGASSVVILEPNPGRIEQAARTLGDASGALSILSPKDADFEKRIDSLGERRGFDVTIVACSVGSAQAQALSLAAKRGRVSLFGGLPGEAKGFLDGNLIHYKELGVFGVHASTAAQNRQVLSWIREGRLDARAYIGAVYPLSDIELAFTALEEENILKAVIHP